MLKHLKKIVLPHIFLCQVYIKLSHAEVNRKKHEGKAKADGTNTKNLGVLERKPVLTSHYEFTQLVRNGYNKELPTRDLSR